MQRDTVCERECQYAKTRKCETACAPACRTLLGDDPVQVDKIAELSAQHLHWSSAEVMNHHYHPWKPELDIGDFWKWDPKFDTEEYQQKIVKAFGLSPSFFDHDAATKRLFGPLGEQPLDPGFGSSVDSIVHGPLSATSVRAAMQNWMATLKDQRVVGDFNIGQVSMWTCVDHKVDKRRRMITLFWRCDTHLAFRTTVRHFYKRMPARRFKSEIRRARREVGGEIMDMDFMVRPVLPVNYITFQINFDYALYEKHSGTLDQAQPVVDPVDAPGNGPRITHVAIGNGPDVSSIQHFRNQPKDQ